MTYTKIAMITLACASAFSSHAYAQINFNSSCDANINADINFANNQLLVKSSIDQDVVFQTNGDLTVDGIPITLTASQQILAKRYYKGVEDTIPVAVDITLESLDIAKLALTEVFAGLLGDSSNVSIKINNRLRAVSTSIKLHVYQNPESITFNSQELKKELGLGNDVGQEIQKVQKEIVTEAMGELLVVAGKAMMSGNSNFGDLQKKMESVSEEIQAKAESIGKQLEEKADVLCEKIKDLDETENQLQSVSALQYFNMIDLKSPL